jgi:omega-hydroxy-beta-dihydromenaquinone-9 sulfotransferase
VPQRDSFARQFGAGILPGILLGDWLRLLADNRFAVSPSCWFRAGAISCCSVVNSVCAVIERHRYGAQVSDVTVPPPVFILGHWRQGTTHLHNLLATDDRFGYPTLYQVCFPHTFLTTESTWGARAVGKLLPDKRPMDNMALGVELPFEDEYALCASGRYSPYLSGAFPRRREYYDRYLTLHDIPKDELDAWKRQLLEFLKKLTLRCGRPLILKSPTHTCRIRILLEMFPGARFIHIHRNPYAVVQSTRHQLNVALDWYQLQTFDRSLVDEWILQRFRRMYETFLDERSLIPAGQFCEVAFEQLECEPIAEVRRIYETLGLPAFDGVADRLSEYVDSLSGYQKNVFPALSDELSERVRHEWGFAFREWGYAT